MGQVKVCHTQVRLCGYLTKTGFPLFSLFPLLSHTRNCFLVFVYVFTQNSDIQYEVCPFRYFIGNPPLMPFHTPPSGVQLLTAFFFLVSVLIHSLFKYDAFCAVRAICRHLTFTKSSHIYYLRWASLSTSCYIRQRHHRCLLCRSLNGNVTRSPQPRSHLTQVTGTCQSCNTKPGVLCLGSPRLASLPATSAPLSSCPCPAHLWAAFSGVSF